MRNQYDSQTPYITSFVILRREDGKVPFLLRKNTPWMNDYFGIASGKVEKGEFYIAAAIREAHEELGVEIAPEDLKMVHTMHFIGKTE